METKEKLINLLRDAQMTKAQLKKNIIYPCLRKRHDIMVVKPMTEELLNGKLPEQLNDEDTLELLQLLGEDVETPKVEIKKTTLEKEEAVEDLGEGFFEKDDDNGGQKDIIEEIEPKVEVKDDLLDKYNTMLVENKTLKKDSLKKDETINELKEQVKTMTNKMNKFEKVMESLKKFNITEIGEYVEIADDDVNELYRGHLTEGKTELKDAHLLKKNGQIIVTKSYYKVETKESEEK